MKNLKIFHNSKKKRKGTEVVSVGHRKEATSSKASEISMTLNKTWGDCSQSPMKVSPVFLIKKMKLGSLFSGIGGIEIGFKKQGYNTEWFVENDLYAQAILKKRFPSAKIYEDITQTDFRTVPKVDILTGGFPCQDISNAGKRAGIQGSRSSLWKHYLRAINTIRPKIAFIENVSALLNRGLDVVLCDLAKIGYDAEWHCVPASAVGALHKRDRIFIICHPHDNGSLAPEKRKSITQGSEGDKKGKKQAGKPERSNHEQGQVAYPSCFGSSKETNRGTHEGGMEEISNSTCFGQHGGICSNRKEQDWVLKCEQEWSKERGKITGRNTLRGEKTTWAVEPPVGRMADGIPNRVDRIKCIGNAVVPQLAEVFAKAIKKEGLEKR